MNRLLIIVCIAVLLLCAAPRATFSAVDLEWRPDWQVAHVGDVIDLGLYAVSTTGSNHPISGLDAIVFWDPSYMEFENLTNQGAPYDWYSSGFPSPGPDNLNYSWEDGSLFYTAWGELGVPAMASTKGLLVTTLVFSVRSAVCRDTVTIPASYGSQSLTRVFDGTVPNLDVKGRLGSATVMVVPAGVLTSVAEAKTKSNETSFDIGGPIVTRVFASETCFYFEDYNRVAGIRVNCAAGQLPAMGQTPIVHGTIRIRNGERVVDATDVSVGPECTPVDVPDPLAMVVRAISQGLDPQGLLVKLSGLATSVGTDSFVLQDGSFQGARVELYGVSAPGEGDFVLVTGAMGADGSGPVLRVNSSGDVQTVPH